MTVNEAAGMWSKSVDEMKLVGGHRALDLVNTVAQRAERDRHDYLATPDDLLAFSGRAGLADAEELAEVGAAWQASPQAATRALAAVRDIREALYALLSGYLGRAAGGSPPDSELAHLSLAWTGAASRSRLVVGDSDPRPGGVAAHWVSVAPPALLLQDRAAVAAVELLTGTDATRLGICDPAAGGCGWLFLDHTRNRSRRWCTMEDCGAEVKARRLTERRRVGRESGRLR
jgi:predicted RNA-binding Zn ribbon-like protein